MTSAEFRQSFLEFFAARGHTIVPSASLLPDSPGLLFTNAGMNQFVPIFLGERAPDVASWAGAQPARDTRAADTQKCIRAGGKHNDLEDVGFDTYHHTLFEMLGNWSFGDYFKRESLTWGWELLTRVWGIPPRRLFASVYSPDAAQGDPSEFDHEAHAIWTELFTQAGLDPELHIVRGNKKDNFWMMGDTGPCGPCSEIHFNLLPGAVDDPAVEAAGRRLVNAGSPRCIEIWNHVFIQFNANADGTFAPLAAKHVDTGMGFDRVAGIAASTRGFTDFSAEPSNYASDLFAPLFARIAALSGRTYTATVPRSREGLSEAERTDVAFRVLADHARAVSCAIADGILPGNEGRNYVVRRILRRGLLYGSKLGLKPGFFEQLIEPVVGSLGGVFPELRQREEMIHRVVRSEEETFGRTLERGLKRFEEAYDHLLDGPEMDRLAVEESINLQRGEFTGRVIPGAVVFELYDTYGFPVDMTQVLATERGLTLDVPGFDRLMEEQRQRGRAALKREVLVAATAGPEGSGAAKEAEHAPTRFVGYDLAAARETQARLVDVVAALAAGADTFLVFDPTPFYAEMGGQVGDRGWALIGGQRFEITDTIKDKAGRHLHRIGPSSALTTAQLQALTVSPAALGGDPAVGREGATGGPATVNSAERTALLFVDLGFRRAVQRHHTATHLLNWALRKVLGDHVRQAGSLNAPDRLRFDFSHFEAITPAQLKEIEALVNGHILDNAPVTAYETEFDRKPAGTLAFFGEKYGRIVRVVDIGGYSRELCGGTHVGSTGEIGLVKVLSEGAVAAGVRRLEAVAGQAALDQVAAQEATLAALGAKLAAPTADLPRKLETVLAQKAEAEKQLKGFQQKAAAGLAADLAAKASMRDGLKFVSAVVAVESPEALRALGAQVLAQLGDGGVVQLGVAIGDKATVSAFCSPAAIKLGHQAGKIVGELSAKLGGKGGGKPDFAMGGGRDVTKLTELFSEA
jgi:alanyl-tRNA synthetase